MNAIKLACAFTVAVVASILTWNRPWARAGDLYRILRDVLHDEKVHPQDYRRRLACCAACPIYFKPLGTCGTPLKKELRTLGCWCVMSQKAKLRHATCWLRVRETHPTGYGWTDGL